jgi:hypothetical protein
MSRTVLPYSQQRLMQIGGLVQMCFLVSNILYAVPSTNGLQSTPLPNQRLKLTVGALAQNCKRESMFKMYVNHKYWLGAVAAVQSGKFRCRSLAAIR